MDYGSRLTLYIVVLVAIIAAPVGLLVGTTAGYLGGWVDRVLMRITDIFLAFPKLVLALALVSALGDRKSTRLNSSQSCASRMPSSAQKKQASHKPIMYS